MFFGLVTTLGFASCAGSAETEQVLKRDTIVINKMDTINLCLPYASIGGAYTGKISKGELQNCTEMKLLNNTGNYKVLSFFAVHESRGSGHNKVYNFGAKFGAEVNEMFQRLEARSRVSFENIKAVGAENDTVILNSMVFQLPG